MRTPLRTSTYMKLIYEWIYESHEKNFDKKPILSNLNLNFSERYEISFNASEGILTVNKRNIKISDDFYGCDCVESINCIAGENGCGKTTILKHLYKTDMYSIASESNKTIQIFEEGDKLFYFSNIEIKKIEAGDLKICEIEGQKHALYSKIFITNDMYGYLNLNDSDFGQYSLLAFTPYDISSFAQTIMDCFCLNENRVLQHVDNFEYYNSFFFSHPIVEVAFNSMYLLLLRDAIDNKWKDFDYISGFEMSVSKDFCLDNINGNSLSLYQTFQHLFEGKEKEVLSNSVDETSKKILLNTYHIDYESNERVFKIFAIYNLVKLVEDKSDNTVVNLRSYLKTEILNSILEYVDTDSIHTLSKGSIEEVLSFYEKQVLPALQKKKERRFKRCQDEFEYFKRAYDQTNALSNIVGSETRPMCLFDNLQKQSTKLLDFLVQEIISKHSFILKYAYLAFKLSGGERSFLNIFACVNSLRYLKNLSLCNNENVYDNILLLLDEPDLMCHPEWQRKMVYNLIEMCKRCFADKKVQIIMTTHSPLILSDFPRERVITIDKNANLSTIDCQTFGSNIYDLYKQSFFLEEFCGEFAETKINNAAEMIYKTYTLCLGGKTDSIDSDKFNEAVSTIELIGEPLLKNSFEKIIEHIRGIMKND